MPCLPTRLVSIYVLVAAVHAGGATSHVRSAPPAAPEVAPTDPAPLVAGNTAFALDLYRHLADRDGNIFLSPHSVSTAMAMTWAGARGETAAQMAGTLRFDPGTGVHPAFEVLAESIAGADEDSTVELTSANRLWGREGGQFVEAFLETARRHYGGGFETVDFGATEDSRRRINGWIEGRTRERIRDLLRPGDLSAATVLVLTNAIHFKGTWLVRFDEQLTRDEAFFVEAERPVIVPLMELTGPFGLLETDEVQALELPYDGGRLSMVVLLPRDRGGLAALEAGLTEERLGDWLAGLRERRVRVRLPRFGVESRFHLEHTLPRMGMPLAFAAGRADFSGICGAPGEIWIDLVIHQSFVEVDEAGTEAAAATAVVLKRGGPAPPAEFRADHPFVFLIRDRETGAILFLGRVTDPRP
jgi:serpin B